MADIVSVLSPVGRMVQGHPFEERNTNMEGNPLVDKAGAARVEFFFAVAFLKTDAAFNPMWAQVQAVAQRDFPMGQAAGFSWKYVDGDSPDYVGREGFAGCHILRFSGGFAPEVYTRLGTTGGALAQVIEKTALKRGDYVRVSFNPKGNASTTRPGVYLNPRMLELIGYGAEIRTSPSGDEVFKDAAALPVGASAMPTAGAVPPAQAAPGMPPAQAAPGMPPAGAAPGMPPAGAAPGMPPAQAAPGMPPAQAAPGMPPAQAAPGMPPAQAAPGMPPAQAAPAHDFVANAGAIDAPVKTMTAAANGVSYADHIAKGWTDSLLIQHGLMTA